MLFTAASYKSMSQSLRFYFPGFKIDMEDSSSGHHSDMDLGNLMNMTWPTDLIDAMNIENSQGPNQPDPSNFLRTQPQPQQSQPYQYQLDEIWNDPTLLLQQNVVQNQVEVPILSQLNQRQQSQNSGQPSKSAERSKRNRENKKKEMESLKNEKIEATKIEEKLRDDIKNLNEEKRKLDTKIEELNTKIENLNKEKGALEEKIENLNKEKTEKEKDNKVLTANMTTIKDEIIKLAAQYESISCRQSDESTYIQSEFQQIHQKLETVQLNVMDVKHVVLASSKQWNENIPKQSRQLNIRREVVLELDVQDGNDKQKAMEIVSGLSGVDSVSKDMIDKLKVIGDVDLINLVSKLSKWKPRILTVGPAKEDKKEILFLEKKEEGGGGKKWDNDKKKDQIAEFPPAYRPPYNPFMHNPFMHNPYMHNPYMTMHYPDEEGQSLEEENWSKQHLEETELSGKSLSDSDINNRVSKILIEAKQVLKMSKKIGVNFLGDENDVLLGNSRFWIRSITLWKELLVIKERWLMNWIVGGDFNDVRSRSERLGCSNLEIGCSNDYNSGFKDVYHMFIGCNFIHAFWNEFCYGGMLSGKDYEFCFVIYFQGNIKAVWLVAVAARLRSVWFARNDVVFKEKLSTVGWARNQHSILMTNWISCWV
ncbi:hypothetical protein V6N13_117573 [Hibiscus sabdariffa]